MQCSRCHKEVTEGATFCSWCGYATHPDEKKKPSKLLLLLVAAAVVLVMGGGTTYYFVNQHMQQVAAQVAAQKQADDLAAQTKAQAKADREAEAARIATEAQYTKDICATGAAILDQVQLVEVMTGGIETTWAAAINNGNDFNDAIKSLMNDPQVTPILSDLQTSYNKIQKQMRNLQNPPAKFVDTYNKIVELFGAYSNLYNQAQQPTGSLNSFRDDVHGFHQDILKYGGELVVLVPSIKQSVTSAQ